MDPSGPSVMRLMLIRSMLVEENSAYIFDESRKNRPPGSVGAIRAAIHASM
jgi:hypothetical protein